MPGDKITTGLTLTRDAGCEDIWYAVVVTVTGLDASVNDASALDGLTASDVKSLEGSTMTATISEDITLTGETYDNRYQDQDVTVSYIVVAVQKANVATAAEALPLLKAAVASNVNANA